MLPSQKNALYPSTVVSLQVAAGGGPIAIAFCPVLRWGTNQRSPAILAEAPVRGEAAGLLGPACGGRPSRCRCSLASLSCMRRLISLRSRGCFMPRSDVFGESWFCFATRSRTSWTSKSDIGMSVGVLRIMTAASVEDWACVRLAAAQCLKRDSLFWITQPTLNQHTIPAMETALRVADALKSFRVGGATVSWSSYAHLAIHSDRRDG